MVTAAKCGEEPQKEKFPPKLSNFRIINKTISKRNSEPTLPLHRLLVPQTYCYYYYYYYYYYYPNILVFVTNLSFYLRADCVYMKNAGNNLNISHRRSACNC